MNFPQEAEVLRHWRGLGTAGAYRTGVTIGMPVWEGRLSPVLDVAGRFLVVQIQSGRETSRREVLIAQTSPRLLAKGIKEMGLDVLLCGALSQPVAYWLDYERVRVWLHLCGEAASLVQAFLANTLERSEFRMPGCCLGQCGWHRQRFRQRNPPRRRSAQKTMDL